MRCIYVCRFVGRAGSAPPEEVWRRTVWRRRIHHVKANGPGDVFFELSGEIVERELDSGETLKVDPGHVGLYESSVDMDITRVKGVKNMFFGGEGLFLATLKGPGTVWLQSMPLMNLAARLNPYISSSGD